MYLTPRLFRPTTRSFSSQPTTRRQTSNEEPPGLPRSTCCTVRSSGMGGRQSRCCCCCCYLLHIRAPHQSHTATPPTTDCRVRLDTTCCAPSDFVRRTSLVGVVAVLGTDRPSAFYARRRSRDAFISPALSSTPWRDGATGLARVETEVGAPVVTAMPPMVQLRGYLTLSPWRFDQLTRRA